MYIVECETDDGKKWLATKGPGPTNYLTTDRAKAFLFEEENMAELYAKIWAHNDTEKYRVVEK